MSSHKFPNIPSLRKQQLSLEFASLKHAAPPGVYVSINNPADPTLWSGVFFVRSGPYASAILRFAIRFPASYPELPPLVTFNTDIFHPLVVPLTTYTFTTGSSNEAPVSATDEERLSPGAFSLRHGFPHWFGRAQRTASNSVTPSRNISGGSIESNNNTSESADNEQSNANEADNRDAPSESVAPSTPKKQTGEGSLVASPKENVSRISPLPANTPYTDKERAVPVVTLLDYIRSTFDDETVLDSLPLEAAGNPGAWHAWKAHRRNAKGTKNQSYGSGTATPDRRGVPQARLPGEWNWEGVWAKRVYSGVEASQSDSVLFGNVPRAGDDTMRFLNIDDATLASIKEKILPASNE
ncbi:putative ubiquitin-conjugating enzyme [Talaromyces proteolyticus]|uniref:Ubiquitin-conjugating enzyme n=1 Tax=Talaromyces proteolyticus TaxID=1131652 RepID=A0AAD4Q1P4_9EURO|nr:putative ubiquitin-conjugating enzyme [Talaromyces proteolyticus]KAH8698758.1 putative ubiquitin-conjugating enzyme [Talaromyces proteolyticus]